MRMLVQIVTNTMPCIVYFCPLCLSFLINKRGGELQEDNRGGRGRWGDSLCCSRQRPHTICPQLSSCPVLGSVLLRELRTEVWMALFVCLFLLELLFFNLLWFWSFDLLIHCVCRPFICGRCHEYFLLASLLFLTLFMVFFSIHFLIFFLYHMYNSFHFLWILNHS